MNELYDTLRRYTNIGHYYLLISHLPRNLDIHSELFSMSFAKSIVTLIPISMVQVMPDLSQFNAKPLKEAIQSSLENTDGCFICFGDNTFLCGVINHFFLFDSHSRTSSGRMSANGKGTCKIVKTVDEVHMHIIELALSMGFSNAIECEITGMCCKKISIEENFENEQVQAHHLTSCDVVYIQQEKTAKTEFHRLSANAKLTLC